MKIKLQEALDLINAADLVKLTDMDGFIIPTIHIAPITGDPLNECLYVTWRGAMPFGFKVTEGENTEVDRDGHKLTFIDSEGDLFELNLFREVPILA